jgi:hypothetical protein
MKSLVVTLSIAVILSTCHVSTTHAQRRTITTPVNVSSVAFVLSYCGQPSAMTVAAFAARWLNSPSSSASQSSFTMQNYFANCSYNTYRFLPQNNIVVPAVIDVPCNGTRASGGQASGGQAYDLSSKCGTPEIYVMQEYAEKYARDVLNISIPPDNKRRVILLPRSNLCPWAGLATVGCGGARCNTWINGYGALDGALFFHEMNHNNGAMHSRSLTGGEYGDTSCAMGSGQSCLNAPQNWRLGWATNVPGGFINLTARAAGRWSAYDIPIQHLSNRNMLRIHPDLVNQSSSIRPTNFFVSYRARALPFEQLPLRPAVVIHAYNNTQNGTITQDRTMQLSLLRVNETYVGALGGKRQFVLLVQSTNATHARVTLCRPDATAESRALGNCDDKIDNDCNRIADAREPGCAPAARGAELSVQKGLVMAVQSSSSYGSADSIKHDGVSYAAYVEMPPHIDAYKDGYRVAYGHPFSASTQEEEEEGDVALHVTSTAQVVEEI